LADDVERLSPANFIEKLPNPSPLEAGCAFGRLCSLELDYESVARAGIPAALATLDSNDEVIIAPWPSPGIAAQSLEPLFLQPRS
jgi:hypothetical protein